MTGLIVVDKHGTVDTINAILSIPKLTLFVCFKFEFKTNKLNKLLLSFNPGVLVSFSEDRFNSVFRKD